MVLINMLFCLEHHHRMVNEILSVTKQFSEFIDTITTDTKDLLKENDVDIPYHMGSTADFLDYATDRVNTFCSLVFRQGVSEDELDYLSGYIDSVVETVKKRISLISEIIDTLKDQK